MRNAPLAILIVLCQTASGSAGELFDDAALRFARELDLRTLSLLGVQHSGRVAVLDTLAREQLAQFYGSERVDDTEPAFAYLEVYFNTGAYLSRPVIPVREKKMREFLARHMDPKRKEEFLRTQRLPPICLVDEQALGLLARTRRATMSDFAQAGEVPSLRDALAEVSRHGELRVALDRLSARYWSFLSADGPRFIPAEGTWISTREALLGLPDLMAPLTELSPALVEAAARLAVLRDAWRSRDSQAANRVIAELAGSLPGLAAAGEYPSTTIRRLELLYNRLYKTTIAWVGYAAAMLLLILAAASGRRWARSAGLGAFGVSTAALLAGFIGRWIISGRQWYLPPIMNQFEAVTGSALLAAVLALALEMFWKRNYFALAAAFYATVALLCGFFLPEQMGAGISAQPGILASPVMAIHVAVIIIGHAMVGMTFFISAAYLVVFSVRRGAGGEAQGVIDRCNLIVSQLACWTVALGTILGAYWGDFAWGRWWGWDPKETWALITAMVYVAILHLRLVVPVRWRGLTTALGCILGCLVMLFNWIFVNYFIPGKHSYA